MQMRKFLGLSTPIWIAVWVVAITVTLVGRSSGGAIWKADIQLPGLYVVLVFGWLLGPFGTIMTPPCSRCSGDFFECRRLLFVGQNSPIYSGKIEDMTDSLDGFYKSS